MDETNKIKDICDLFVRPDAYLRPTNALKDTWTSQMKSLYDVMKTDSQAKNVFGAVDKSHQEDTLPTLTVENMDTEQIWQQIELQNTAVLEASDKVAAVKKSNFFYRVIELDSLLKHGQLQCDFLDRQGLDDTNQNSSDNEDENSSDENRIDNSLHIENKENSMLDIDNYDSRDESEMEEEFTSNRKIIQNKSLPKFEKTTLDSGFLSWRECEWQSDNNFKIPASKHKGGADDDSDEKDALDDLLYGDGSESEDEGQLAEYKDFFDPPLGGSKDTKPVHHNSNSEEGDLGVCINSIDPPLKSLDKKSGDYSIHKDEDQLPEHSDFVNSPSESQEQKLGDFSTNDVKSTFEKEREQLAEVMASLEEDNVKEKPWFLKGEVQATSRPENSTLEEHLDYDIAARQKLRITEDTTSKLEKIIISRIRSGAWDDVERKIKPMRDPAEFKKKLLLEQEKSKQSLAQIYEQEYVKQKMQEGAEEGEEEIKDHTEIKSQMKDLFAKLNALSNYHYTPPMRTSQVKVMSNLPAIRLEEATPVTVSDASLLAPQEILEPVRGELKGDGEKTPSDRHRERRHKKAFQRSKAQQEDKLLAKKLRNMDQAGKDGRGGRLDMQTASKAVQRAVKSGHIKMLGNDGGGKMGSSETFFKKMQENVVSAGKHKKGRYEKKKGTTASKILL